MKIFKINVLSVMIILMVSCDAHFESFPNNDCETDENHDNKKDSYLITFTKAQAENADLKIEQVKFSAFNNVIKVGGKIESAFGDEETVVAKTSGIVKFVKNVISEGVYVYKKVPFIYISSTDIIDGDPAKKIEIEFEDAKRSYLRAEELIKDKILSDKEFEKIKLRYYMAKSAYDSQSENATSTGYKISSSISGFIKKCFVSQGDYVTIGYPIVTITKNKRLQLIAEVPESDFEFLKFINTANFTTSYNMVLYKLADLNGTKISSAKSKNDNNTFVNITFEFDNKYDFISGSFVEVYLISLEETNVISVPVAALTEEQGIYFVYLYMGEEKYKKQEVKIGQNNGERVVLLSGIRERDNVVVNGAYQIKLAANANVITEGHSH